MQSKSKKISKKPLGKKKPILKSSEKTQEKNTEIKTTKPVLNQNNKVQKTIQKSPQQSKQIAEKIQKTKLNKKPLQQQQQLKKKQQQKQVQQESDSESEIEENQFENFDDEEDEEEKEIEENNEDISENLEQENDNNDDDQEEEDLNEEDSNMSESEENQQNQENQEQKQQQQSQNQEIVIDKTLTKNLQSGVKIGAIYTGGKIQVSNDENFLFSSANFKITKLDLQTKEIIDTIEHNEEEIANFTLHPTDKYIATFTKNFLLRLINVETKEVLQMWKIQDHFPLDMQFDPSGKFLAIGCVNGTIKIFDCKKGSETHSYRIHRGSVTKLMFHPHKAKYQLASTGDDFSVKIYDLVISKTLVGLNGHKSQVNTIQFSETGTNLISGGEKIIIWDLVSFKQQATIKYEEDIEALNYFSIKSQQGKQSVTKNYLIVAGVSGVFKAIDISDDNVEVTSFKHLKTHEVLKIMSLKKKNQIAMVTNEQNIMIYDLLEGPKLKIADVIVGFNDEVTDAKFKKIRKGAVNPFEIENESIILSANSNLLRAIDIKTKKTQLLQGHTDIIMSVDVFEDYIISGSKDKTIRLWKKLPKIKNETEEENGMQQEEQNEQQNQDSQISAEEQLEQRINNIKNYYSPDYMQIAEYHGHIEAVSSISIGPKTGKFFASCSSDKSVKIWDIQPFINENSGFNKSGSHFITKVTNSLHSIQGHEKDINVVKMAPNEKLLASASQDRSIKIWNCDNLTNFMTLKGHKRGVWDIAFSPVEQVLASAAGDQTVKIWNLQDGQCMHTLEGHIGSVLKVQWICHGLQLLSAGGDSLLKIWNVKKQTCVNTFEEHEGKIWALDASNYDKNGKQYFLTGGNDSNFILYDDITKQEELKKKEEEHEVLIQQQNYQSFIREKDYIAAAKLAFKQNFTSNFYKSLELLFKNLDFQNQIIFQDFEMKIKTNEEHCKQQESQITDMIQYFVDQNLSRLLVFIRNMNISQKHCKVAQKVLSYLLQIVHIDNMIQMKKKFVITSAKKQIEKGDFDNLLDALELYSQKHFERTNRFIKKSYYLDFVINKIDAMALNHNIETD